MRSVYSLWTLAHATGDAMSPAPKRHEIVEQLRRDLARRFPDAVRPPAPHAPARAAAHLPTGYPDLDALLPGGGLPPGRLVAITGPASSGKLSIALAVAARATAHGRLCAFIDTGGELFPPSAAACGIDLARLLVVRPPPAAVLRAVGVTVQSRAFALVVLDLAATPDGAPRLTAAQATRLGALCRETEVTLLALGAPAALQPLVPVAAVRLRAAPSPTGARVALDGGAAVAPGAVELRMVRHASYCLRAAAQLRLASPPARPRR
jgi:protein ImuA